ncbi:MAG TPA: class I SAM-dependent methyltransferase [Bryobacteraceae bacterium]|nr:class I SAM-dependent methyltransferase [Bryobacteraceae bacterium]
MALPADLQAATQAAWERARDVPGYLGEREFGALMMLFAGATGDGVAVEIGSFKGKSTTGLATLAKHYSLGQVISIDPHNAPSVTDPILGATGTSFDEFKRALRNAGVEDQVEAHRAKSGDVAKNWNRPIRFLWIDGDHTYEGAKLDFDLFMPFVVPGGIVAIHDTLHEFEGPIRVFVEDMLRSDTFGPAGLLHTIGWAQYRPSDGAKFRKEREALARRAARLIPLVEGGRPVKGFSKMLWKVNCALIPHQVLSPAEWDTAVSR